MLTRNHKRGPISRYGITIFKDPHVTKEVQLEKDLPQLTHKGRKAVCKELRRRYKRKDIRIWTCGTRLVAATTIPTTWRSPRDLRDRDKRIEAAASELARAINQAVKHYEDTQSIRRHRLTHAEVAESLLRIPAT